MRILLIGDDDGTAGYVVRGLSKAGHICDRLADGRDGLFHASREDYDVIVADRMLPGLDELSMIFSRFDRRDGGRVPYISARTALGKVGHASGFYTDIADIIRTVSTRPAR
jgi:two-component system OmpR family response regulator